MTGLSILLLLLAPPQDPRKVDEAADRAKRAAIVDKIMAEPPKPGVVRIPQAEAFEQLAVRRVVAQVPKRVTLELKAVAADEEKDENGDPVFRARMGARNINELALSKDNFDRWLFEDTLSEEARKSRLEAMLSVKLQMIATHPAIGAEELRKLRLAGNGDIKRFLDRIEAARADFEVARQDYTAGRVALSQLEPLGEEYKTGPFGPNSLMEKTLRKIRSEMKPAPPEVR